jgi:hypothetical protein
MGDAYPAVTSACCLGERILNRQELLASSNNGAPQTTVRRPLSIPTRNSTMAMTSRRACYRGISAEITAAQKKACSDHASRFREHDLDGRGREVHEWQIAPGVVDRHSHAQETERPARCRPFGCIPSADLYRARTTSCHPLSLAAVPLERLPVRAAVRWKCALAGSSTNTINGQRCCT